MAVGFFILGVYLIVRPPNRLAALNGVVQIVLAFFWLSMAKRERKSELAAERTRRGECEQCGYSLTGNASGVCPECGSVLPVVAMEANGKSTGAAIEIRVPGMGRVKAITLVRWLVADGARVSVGEPIVELETEKANVSHQAAAIGKLEQIAVAGRPVLANQLVGRIHPD